MVNVGEVEKPSSKKKTTRHPSNDQEEEFFSDGYGPDLMGDSEDRQKYPPPYCDV